jgi:hypothetical protein
MIATGARPMITERKQPITCFISTKSEIPHDQAAPSYGRGGEAARTALTVTGRH